MTIRKVLSASFTGTTAMTVYSYFLSGKENRQFKEPVLLNELLSNSFYAGTFSKTSAAGWFLHYSIGSLFATGSHFIWKSTSVKPSLISGSLLGFIYGIIGIAGWHLVFLFHSNPPSIDLKKYYLHLLTAHVVYGLGTTAGYRLLHR